MTIDFFWKVHLTECLLVYDSVLNDWILTFVGIYLRKHLGLFRLYLPVGDEAVQDVLNHVLVCRKIGLNCIKLGFNLTLTSFHFLNPRGHVTGASPAWLHHVFDQQGDFLYVILLLVQFLVDRLIQKICNSSTHRSWDFVDAAFPAVGAFALQALRFDDDHEVLLVG